VIISDPKKAAGVIVAKMNKDGSDDVEEVTTEGGDILHGIAEDLIHAVKIGSVESVASALKAAFNCMESEEGEGL